MTDKRFIEKFEENVRLYPDKVILQDQNTKLTFRELDDLSGRVYAYLKQKGIGREDFVMIVLPRGVKCYIALLGVWKAGGATVLFEDDVPRTRVRYVFDDCQCKVALTMENWHEVMRMDSCAGHEIVDDSDAAFALYTSGSTGFPKGVVHEYGKFDSMINSIRMNGDIFFKKDDIFGLPLPLSATGAFVLMIASLNEASCTHILPYGLVMNPTLLSEYVTNEHITITGLIPSLVNRNRVVAPSLRTFITGGDAIHDFYLEDCPVLCFYGQTETAMTPHTFVLDRRYEIAPIGKLTGVCDAYLLDEEYNIVREGEMGELCYTYHYSRGYINDPELTAKVFRNGLFHTGDIARINEDGNYVILGRKTDMIKINGNRIEPAEIEAAVKRVLGIDWAFAKGFVSPERSFICVYYTADIAIDYAATREALLNILPKYMIPAYFVHVDDVPRLPNGKIDRQAFQAPEVQEFIADYVAPTNELEERLCSAMQQVLDMERIGINDDFYLLGGDSLRTIRLVSECNIPDLTVSDVYSARTPAQIALRWLMRQ